MFLKIQIAWLAALLSLGGAHASGTLYANSGSALFDGKFGPVAEFQAALSDKLVSCLGTTHAIPADGKFTSGTAHAIRDFAGCPDAAGLAVDDGAHLGKLTESLWSVVLPGKPVPSLDARIQTLVLTYEATDYTSAEWNFCQNKPFYDPGNPNSICHSNDKESYLTWGPRGATAGHGREVQAILWLASEDDATLLQSAFGASAPDVQRFIGLSPHATELFLCAIWADVDRRKAWKDAFAKVGENDATRAAYDRYYTSSRSDGSKIETFFDLYRQAGVTPSEVDYGLFVDRATHSSAPKTSALPGLAAGIKAFAAGKANPNAYARLWIARNLLAGNGDQLADRRGRDVAFVIDAFDGAGVLTATETGDWKQRGRLKASDIGLRDTVAVPTFHATHPDFSGMPAASGENLTPAETTECPQTVLNPASPPH